jgi:hypothetical protein
MKASHGYRASNRYLKPTLEVVPSVLRDAYHIVVRLATNERTAFDVTMSCVEAIKLAHELLSAAGQSYEDPQ